VEVFVTQVDAVAMPAAEVPSGKELLRNSGPIGLGYEVSLANDALMNVVKGNYAVLNVCTSLRTFGGLSSSEAIEKIDAAGTETGAKELLEISDRCLQAGLQQEFETGKL
jgi:hypothetical protein